MSLQKSRVSLFALACGASVAALSATAYAQAAPDQLETVVVTGFRQSLRTSEDIKRTSSGVVDAITAEDIGKFPDTNLAESIQRIPGVTIDRANGEGSRVTVRGFGPEYNLVTLNGRSMPGSINGNTQAATRSFDFANLASDDIAGINVYKTGRADVSSGGIGSTIDIRTARPFDHSGFVASGSAKVNYDTTNRIGDDYTPEFSGLISDTFFEDKLGLLVSGSYSVRDSGLEQATIGGWLQNQDLSQGTVANSSTNPYGNTWAPQNENIGVEDHARVRTNLQAVVQLRPVQSLTATVDFTYALFKDHYKQNIFGAWFGYGSDFVSATVNKEGTVTDLVDAANDVAYDSFDDHLRNELKSVGLNLNWDAADWLNVKFDAHHSAMASGGDPKSGNNIFGIVGQTPSIMTPGLTRHFHIGDGAIPWFTYNFVAPYNMTNLGTSTVSPLFFQANNNVFNTTIDQARLDSDWTNSSSHGLTSIQFGVEFKRMKTHAEAWNSFIPTGFYNAADAGMLPASAYSKISTCGILQGFSGGGCDIKFPYFYTYSVASFVAATEPKYGPYSALPPTSPTSDNNITEFTKAVYAQANFDSDLFDRPFKLVAGLRYEQVDVTARSLQTIPTAVSWDNPTEFHTVFSSSAAFTKVQAHNDEFLPSIDASLEVLPNVLVRTSFSKTDTRSDLNSMVGTIAVTTTPKPGARTATAGNPALLPYESYNYDVTAEWYYGLDDYVSVNWFTKEVVNFLTQTTTKQSINGITDPYVGAQEAAAEAYLKSHGTPSPSIAQIFGQMETMYGATSFTGQAGDPLLMWDVTRPSNANTVNIHGFEFAWQHVFGETGFGVQASLSLPTGGARLDPQAIGNQFALPGLSKSWSLMAFYEKYGFQARLAYTHRGSFLSSLGQAYVANEPVYTNAYGQLDASASYDITDNISIVWDGVNLTGESITQHGRYADQFVAAYQGGARYQLGVHVKY